MEAYFRQIPHCTTLYPVSVDEVWVLKFTQLPLLKIRLYPRALGTGLCHGIFWWKYAAMAGSFLPANKLNISVVSHFSMKQGFSCESLYMHIVARIV